MLGSLSELFLHLTVLDALLESGLTVKVRLAGQGGHGSASLISVLGLQA